MVTDPAFVPMVEAVTAGEPVTEAASLPGEPDIAEADETGDPVIPGALMVVPIITSALTGG